MSQLRRKDTCAQSDGADSDLEVVIPSPTAVFRPPDPWLNQISL